MAKWKRSRIISPVVMGSNMDDSNLPPPIIETQPNLGYALCRLGMQALSLYVNNAISTGEFQASSTKKLYT